MTMITPSYLGETIEYSSLHACRSTLEDPTSIHTEGLQGTDERVGAREIEPGKHQAGDGAVQEKIVPFNGRPDSGSQYRAAKLPPTLCLVNRTDLVIGCHPVSLR